jgi:hypothetical protein
VIAPHPAGRSVLRDAIELSALAGWDMSERFIVVNHDRLEHFNPTTLGESGKVGGVIDGPMTTLAVSLLAVRSTRVKPRDKAILTHLAMFGAWSGNRLELIGRYEERYHDLATRYADISYAVIALLCNASDRAVEHFVTIFGHGNVDTVEVGSAIFAQGCERLRNAIEARYGADWTRLFKEASSKSGDGR